MNFLKNFPRNPASPEAIRIQDLKTGLVVEVVSNSGAIATRGVVAELPTYDGDEWHGAAVAIGEETKPLESIMQE